MFIEVTNKKEGFKQFLNINNIESLTYLKEGALIHFVSGSVLTITESYETIKMILSNK